MCKLSTDGNELMDNYYAFCYLGVCHPLGNCGDIFVANEIADDLLGDDWAFIYTAKDIIDLVKIVKNTTEMEK